MNWKVGLPAAALIITLMPTGAFCRNHHILNGLSPSAGLTGGTSALGGATSILGNHSSLTSGLTNGLTSAASPVASTLTNGLTNHSVFNSGGLFNNNNSLLNNNNGLFHRKHKRNLLSRLLNALLPGRFSNGRFNNNGSIFGNTSPGNGFRSMLGRNF
jgi:hypothetical protein